MVIIKNIEIRSTLRKDNYLELASNLSHVNINSGDYLIKVGVNKILATTKVIETEYKTNILFLNQKVLDNLHIPTRTKLNLKVDGTTLILGPIIGVFISEQKIQLLKDGGWDSVYWRFQNYGLKHAGLVYFFMLADIDWDELKVDGYYFDQNKSWTKCSFPLPEVVYDRCFGLVGRENAYSLRQMIADKGLSVKVFNKVVRITKIDTYQHLTNYPDVNDHLPVFLIYSPENLSHLINKFKSLYIKPDNLYKGKGIVKVTQGDGHFLITFREDDSNKAIKCQDIGDLQQQIELMLQGGITYVIQADIELATFLGNRFDMRVMLQKRESLLWDVTAINARITPLGSVISGPRSGGKAFRIKDVLAMSLPGKEAEIIEQIKSLAIKIGCKMEEKYGLLGELGIDLGVDVNGKVWLIEVNGRPLKVSFTVMKDRSITKLIYQSLIFFGFSLCGFDITPKIKSLSSSIYGLYSIKLWEQDWPQRIIYLNPQQMKTLMFEPGQLITLQVGFSSVEVEIRIQEADLSFNTMYLSGKAFYDLPYYHGENISLIMVSDCDLVLNPTVGMTISVDSRDYIEESYEIKKTALLALEKGIFLYFFSLDRIDWKRELVLAHYLKADKKWDKKYLPFPQVLYDLATFPFDQEKRLEAKEANRRLRQDHHLLVINSMRSLGKWQTCNALTFFEGTKQFVPETTLLSTSDLKYFLDKYNFTFAKSNYGSFGEEVLRLEQTENSYLCRTGGVKVKEWVFYNITNLYEFLLEELGADTILQNDIALAKLNDRIFDMRVLCQKDISGQWNITAINFRVAPAGGVITNHSAGADEVLVVPGDKLPHPDLSWESITCFTKKILLALEAVFGTMGEIGLDVGLDMQGKLWLIEANSKPNTIGYRELTTEDIYSQVYGRPLDYAKFLVKQMFSC